MKRRLPLGILLLLSLVSPAAARSRNLYEWLALAPTIVVGEVRVDDQRHIAVRVERVLRGNLVQGQDLLVDLRRANRERSDGSPRLDLEKGRTYLMLLARRASRTGETETIFDLVRDADGARLLDEGGEAVIDAAARMAAWQDRRNERLLWTDLARALDDANPLVVECALDLFAKFRRADAGILPALDRLLKSPRDDFREKAAQLLGSAAARSADSPSSRDAVSALVAVARRDAIPAVRIAATRALGDLGAATPIEVLREIARADAEQSVRYEAQRILVERGATEARTPD